MDMAAFYFQAAEAAATVTVGAVVEAEDVESPKLPSSRTAVLHRIDVQQAVGLGGGEAAAHGKTLNPGAAAVGMVENDSRAREGGCRDLICPECGKSFLSDKAMYGHLRAHPERGYKGASRPATPIASASAAAGDARPKKAPTRKEAPELPAIKWPVTARRSRTPTIASPPVRAEPAAAVLLEPPRGVEPVPSQMEPPRSVEPAVLLLEPPRSEEEEATEAAMTLMELYHRMRGGAPPEPEDQQVPMQQMHVDNAVAGHQMPRGDQLDLPADHFAEVAREPQHTPVEITFGIILESQAPDVTAAASKGKMPMEPEPVNSGALVLFRDKNDKFVSPGPSKRPKNRPLRDPDQTQPPDAADGAEEDRLPPLRRIPSPASDRRFTCPHKPCSKTFPTHQALGGHMANHNRANKCAADGLAAAHAVNNIMLRHQHCQDPLRREDVLPPAAKAHSCSRCELIFTSGQALGGHMRKHWLEEKMREAPATALDGPSLHAVTPAAVPSAPVNALAVVPANALALEVPAAVVPAAPANALVVPVAAVAPNGEIRDFEFDLNEMPME